MLQLKEEDALEYTEDEIKHIKAISSNWADSKEKTRQIKHKISKHTLKQQECYCVYCERRLTGLSPQIEHIADKGKYMDFSFEPLNLVSSCAYCNGSSNKHMANTLKKKSENYRNCDFLIVHPYLDTVEEHFEYLLDGKTVYDKEKCSEKGQYTIDILGWDKIQFLVIHQDAIDKKEKPLPFELQELIDEICTYKPKNE